MSTTTNNEELRSSSGASDKGGGGDSRLSLEGTSTLSLYEKVALLGLLLLGIVSRFYNLSQPNNIVFDELHYGKYASLYIRRVFFFDAHPPLGKQLIALSSFLFEPQYNGTFRFDRIGAEYPSWVPVLGFRFIPALTGSLLAPATYILCRELGVSFSFSLVSGLLIIFDNAMLIQSRYILMEMPMILFGMLSILYASKFNNAPSWDKALLSAFFGTLSLSVKYVGAFYLIISAFIIFTRIWKHLVPRQDLKTFDILRITGFVYFVFWSTAILTYLAIFYVHLSTLTQAGPHDSVMTSAFQASLKGGLASIIKGQPVEVLHGSQVTLRHSHGRPCWLHSHQHNYPIKYPDGRGSSHQQQVTCYSFKDVNNWWIIKRPSESSIAVNETRDVIKNGEQIHLVHGMSGRLLNSHDVAAPMSPQNQEVSCYIDHNVSMSADPLWQVEIVGGCGTDGDSSCAWHAVKSMVRLIHVSTGQALRMSGKQLPKWGFNQHEVVTDRIVVQEDTIWNVEEHRYTRSDTNKEKEIMEAEMIPTEPTTLSFWYKFAELQWKMLTASGSSQTETHAYSSFPLEWPFLSRGIAYWIGAGNNSQIHFLGNPIIWFTGTLFIGVHLALIGGYALLNRRKLEVLPVDKRTQEQFLAQCGICLGGFGIIYIYHFCLDRTLFLHHYLPAYVFKILLLVCTLDHIDGVLRKNWKEFFRGLVVIWLAIVLHTFLKFSPISYGEPELSQQDLESLRWKQTWDFIIQNPK